jgi:peptidoglycan hydrolase CwlO-like protein
MSLLISLALSNTGAVVLFIILLLVAGIIGYLTAWFYAKSVYKPIIKRLEDEKTALNKQIDGLKSDIGKLNKNIEELNKKVKSLEDIVKKKENEISELKKSIKED